MLHSPSSTTRWQNDVKTFVNVRNPRMRMAHFHGEKVMAFDIGQKNEYIFTSDLNLPLTVCFLYSMFRSGVKIERNRATFKFAYTDRMHMLTNKFCGAVSVREAKLAYDFAAKYHYFVGRKHPENSTEWRKQWEDFYTPTSGSVAPKVTKVSREEHEKRKHPPEEMSEVYIPGAPSSVSEATESDSEVESKPHRKKMARKKKMNAAGKPKKEAQKEKSTCQDSHRTVIYLSNGFRAECNIPMDMFCDALFSMIKKYN